MAAASKEGANTYKWPRPGLTVDAVIVAKDAPPSLLLIQRKHPPCQGHWALPGGFVDEGETLQAAAARELQEETSVDPAVVPFIQTGAYGDPGRDPRGWTVTVAYSAIVTSSQLGVRAADDAQDARWWPIADLPPLAFDHKVIVREAFDRLAQLPAAGDAGLAQQLQVGAAQLSGDWERPIE